MKPDEFAWLNLHAQECFHKAASCDLNANDMLFEQKQGAISSFQSRWLAKQFDIFTVAAN
jgi:hypothetical protein